MKERFLGTREMAVNAVKRLDKFLSKLFDVPIPIKRKIVECTECHAVERYSE